MPVSPSALRQLTEEVDAETRKNAQHYDPTQSAKSRQPQGETCGHENHRCEHRGQMTSSVSK